MPMEIEAVELEITPIPPDTMSTAKKDVMALIENAVRESGHENLLTDKQIQVQVEKTFPIDQAVIVGLSLASNVALEVFKAFILPKLKSRFKVRQKQKAQKARRKH